VKKITPFIFIIFIFGGGLAVYYGMKWEMPLLTGLGLLGLAAGVMFMGIETIVMRESVEHDDSGYTTTYRGWSAVFVGVLWVLLSLAIFVGSVAVIFGQQDSLFQWIKERPGFGLVGLGLGLLAYGGHTLLGAEEERASVLAFLGSLPGRIFALLLIVAGLALLTAGVTEIFLPSVFWSRIEAFQTWYGNLQCEINPAFCGE
jgi:hypothetical protein